MEAIVQLDKDVQAKIFDGLDGTYSHNYFIVTIG